MDIADHYGDRLQAVFDICDVDRKGYITVEHFVALAKEHFGAENGGEMLNDIVNVLDNEGDGRIYFVDFCQGVKQIMDYNSVPSTPVLDSPITELTVFNLDTNERYDINSEERYDMGKIERFNIGSEETLAPAEEDTNSSGTHDTSELSTFNEYDMMTDDDQQAAINGHGYTPSPDAVGVTGPYLASEDDQDSAFGGSDPRREQEVSEEEEKFEDFGEGDELESETDSQATCGSRDPNKLLPPARGRVTTSAFQLASHLYRAAGSSAGTSRRSSCSDEIFDDIDGNFSELNEKVKRLEGQIHMLSENAMKNDERQLRLRDENGAFVERIHQLEEQLRDVEVRSHVRLAEEQRKYREVLSRTDKDKTHEVDTLNHKLSQIEREYTSLKEEAPRLRLELERIRRDNDILADKLAECQGQNSKLEYENKELQQRIGEQRQETNQERDVNAALLDELSKELEELRTFRSESGGRSRSPQFNMKDQKMLRKRELESQIIRLKEENARLLDQNDDLNAQLLNKQLEEGRDLLTQNGNNSFAAEVESLPRDELLAALKEQQEANAKLRDYMENLMIRIMEKNPALLEIDQMNKRKK